MTWYDQCSSKLVGFCRAYAPVRSAQLSFLGSLTPETPPPPQLCCFSPNKLLTTNKKIQPLWDSYRGARVKVVYSNTGLLRPLINHSRSWK
jgi:hypothetical protein